MKRLTFLVLLAATILLGSCSARGLLIYMEEPYWQSLGGDQALKGRLSAVAGKHDMHLELLVSGINDPVSDVLVRQLSRSKEAAIVAGPLFSIDAAQLTDKFPQMRWILLGGPSSSGANRNVIRLRFDRREAFQMMGYASALSLIEETGTAEAAPSGQVSAGGAASQQAAGGSGGVSGAVPVPSGRAGILIPRSRMGADEEVDAFSRGFEQAADKSRLLVQGLNDPIDGEAVRKAVRDMRAQGVEIFLPVLDESNEACLEAVRSFGGCVVTADWEGAGAYANQVFLSVEEDVPGGIDMGIAAADDAGIVYGPVRVINGGARTVPPEVKDKIFSR